MLKQHFFIIECLPKNKVLPWCMAFVVWILHSDSSKTPSNNITHCYKKHSIHSFFYSFYRFKSINLMKIKSWENLAPLSKFWSLFILVFEQIKSFYTMCVRLCEWQKQRKRWKDIEHVKMHFMTAERYGLTFVGSPQNEEIETCHTYNLSST